MPEQDFCLTAAQDDVIASQMVMVCVRNVHVGQAVYGGDDITGAGRHNRSPENLVARGVCRQYPVCSKAPAAQRNKIDPVGRSPIGAMPRDALVQKLGMGIDRQPGAAVGYEIDTRSKG